MRFQVLEVMYMFFGTEHAKGRKEGDLKEFWHFGQYVMRKFKICFRIS
jgi:hypothetical protein